ncbi:1,4-dihydroxy-2-naphthoate polyprenyltransferase [Lacticaseibacillus porcinae]|uniref:1,4-dihydroxy-2-naphthoate polyprenyltransferase n=1 Tax=Lacticaseibacillus porcinae TaxID=1123687 RepID=UPI000F76E8BE|nr:1,4-dihydroxy-2-naphthoate polyprenyltransferase [Lacticaseibacillus porcinae]
MTKADFLELVEFKAKAASVFPCLLGSLYAWWHYHTLDLLALVGFFIAMLLFNMAVDANDNYQDYRRSDSDHFRQETNIIGRRHLDPHRIWQLIVSFTLISGGIGVWLTIRCGWPVLVMGLFSFAVGYGYAGGPYPISRTPFGEFFSGFTMGFVIWLIAVWVNAQQLPIMSVFVASGLPQCAIAALLLANNIADFDEDIVLKRHTIVYYLGRRRALIGLFSLYACGFVMIVIAVDNNLLPWPCLLSLAAAIPVWRNTRTFAQTPVKTKTFKLIVQNLLMILVSLTVTFVIGVIVA